MIRLRLHQPRGSALRSAARDAGFGALISAVGLGIWTLDLAWCLALTVAGGVAGGVIGLAGHWLELDDRATAVPVAAVAGCAGGAVTWLLARPEVPLSTALLVGAGSLASLALFDRKPYSHPRRQEPTSPPSPPPARRMRRRDRRRHRGRRGGGG